MRYVRQGDPQHDDYPRAITLVDGTPPVRIPRAPRTFHLEGGGLCTSGEIPGFHPQVHSHPVCHDGRLTEPLNIGHMDRVEIEGGVATVVPGITWDSVGPYRRHLDHDDWVTCTNWVPWWLVAGPAQDWPEWPRNETTLLEDYLGGAEQGVLSGEIVPVDGGEVAGFPVTRAYMDPDYGYNYGGNTVNVDRVFGVPSSCAESPINQVAYMWTWAQVDDAVSAIAAAGNLYIGVDVDDSMAASGSR